jgi:hypothetical protein
MDLLFLKIYGAFFDAARQKTGLSAPIPQKAFGFSAGFPLLSLAPHGPRAASRRAQGL